MSSVPLLIVGGGIAGLATAIASSRAGRRVHVIEKSPEFAELGAGLQLAPNALRALDRLGVLDEVVKEATFPRSLVMMDAVSGERITSLDLGVAFREHFGYPYVLLHRGDLLAAELRACRASPLVTLHANCEATSIVQHDDHVEVRCADGSVIACEALVGADGLRSGVRGLIHQDRLACSPYVAYRGTLPVSEAPAGSDVDNMTIWVGPELHFVQYAVRGGTVFNQVAVFRSHRHESGHDHAEDWGTPVELDEHFDAMCGRVRVAAQKLERSRRWPMFDRETIWNWTRGRITLLGDAAHPMLQYLAQGAAQSLEDAVCLGEHLRMHADPRRAFVAYQAVRMPRTAMVQRTARLFGELKHLAGAGRAERNALLSKRAADDFEYFESLYGDTAAAVAALVS